MPPKHAESNIWGLGFLQPGHDGKLLITFTAAVHRAVLYWSEEFSRTFADSFAFLQNIREHSQTLTKF